MSDFSKMHLTAQSAPSYPTRCLQFLQPYLTPAANGTSVRIEDHAKVLLKIIIVGGGLGGLATAIALARRGHSVTVLEQAEQLGEVGAGIQIPSNSTRLLIRWGLEPFFKGNVVEPEGMSFRRWKDGNVIGYTKLVPEFRKNFEGPYYVVHRAHFHEGLHKRALELGVAVHVAAKVVEYDTTMPSVKLQDGRSFSGDLIVAADGVKSLARRIVLGGADRPPMKTGFAAYRATVPVEKMLADKDVAWLLERPSLNIWIGEDRHVMSYTIAAGKSFNMVLSHVDHSDPATWNQDTVISDMKKEFEGWDPCLTKIINMIENALKWPLLSGSPLENWVAPSGKLIIMGDAAHAMVPYMSQGAAMAVEDGAALAEVLSQIDSMNQLQKALKVFQTERINRSAQMQEASLVNGMIWHFPDGPEQRARDESMRPEVKGRPFMASANQWSDPVTQWWCYGHDAEENIRKAWIEATPIQHLNPVNKMNGLKMVNTVDGLNGTEDIHPGVNAISHKKRKVHVED